jgi:hypothetical protein
MTEILSTPQVGLVAVRVECCLARNCPRRPRVRRWLYLGYVPCTYASLAKTFVSMHLVNLVIRHKNMVIVGHEDDRDDSENCNLHLQTTRHWD